MRKNLTFREGVRVLGVAFAIVALFGCGLVSVTTDLLATPTPALNPTIGAQLNPAGVTTPNTRPTLALAPANAPPLEPTGNLEKDIRTVVDRVRPAVAFVGIEASVRAFSAPVPVGNGSGAIIDPQGYILTNNHVVEQAQVLRVTLPDGRSFDAQLVGRDPATDLAVIKINGTDLPAIPLGDSSKIEVGDWVVAIGNALGLEGGPTVTKGVVSAKDRTITEENGASLVGLIQTDAAINPGNSGGPLVNLNGELIGINTAIPGPTSQGAQPFGIGFAISINEAKPIVQQLISQGRVIRPYLGVVPVTLTPAIASQLRLQVDKGVILDTVAPNSPAAQAGLKQGDVITAVDGKPMTSEAELRQAIQAHKIGDTMEMTVLRNGRQLTVRAQLAEAPTP